MKNFIKEYFTFNKRERNGIIVLLSIIVLLIISIQLVPIFAKPVQIIYIQPDQQNNQYKKHSSVDSVNIVEAAVNQPIKANTQLATPNPQLFNFNPNTATADELKNLGFSDKLIKTFSNYRNKGGHFYKKEDLKKIYGVKEDFYNAISPYIVFASANNSTSPKTDIHNSKPEIQTPKLLELNSADSASLVDLRGIGPSFARRIIIYRKKLGGFNNLEQLKEVYGLDSVIFALVEPQVSLDNRKLTQININTATVNELKNHPYIKYNIANLIINYRNQHGAYKSVDDIKKLRLLSDELCLKLAPYLTVQ